VHRGTLLLAVLLLADPAPSRAQDPPHWRVFTSSDGLRESWIDDVTVGPGGRVLIAHGAVDAHTIYDGYTFSQVPSAGAPLKLREGPTHQIWALLPGSVPGPTYKGLQLLEGDRWIPYPLDALNDARLKRWQFLPWKADRVLLLTPAAILEFDRGPGAVRVVCRASATDLGPFTDLAPAADGGAWIGGAGGIVHLSPDGDGIGPAIPLGAPWRALSVLRIHDVAGRVFAAVGAEQATIALAREEGRWRELGRATAANETVEAWPGRDGTTWLASISPRGFRLTLDAGSCCRRDLDRTKAFSGRLNAIEPLADGGFWLATSLGLVRHAPAAWLAPPELATTAGGAGALLEASTGDLYALHDQGLLRRRDARWELLPIPPGFLVDTGPTMNVAELADGRIVFGVNTPNGAADATLAFDPRRSQFSPVVHPGGRSVRMLGPAAGGGAWVVTREARHYRLERYDGLRFAERLDAQATWLGSVPRTILELGGGDLLIAPDAAGVGLLRGGRHAVIGRDQGYPGSGSFAAIAIDAGQYWIGDRDGVFAFDGTRWQRLRSGLQTVRGIARTRDGSIWVTSGSGLHRHRDGGWTTVGAAEGLPDGSVSDLLEDRTGAIWVSTTSGLARYLADGDRDPPETSLDLPGNPTEAPPSGDVRIVFAGRDRWNYTPSERLLYAWRLDGGPWSPPEAREAVPLQGLPPGNHRIEVRALDRNWNVDPTPAARAFVVLLPWYRESGFLFVGVLGSMALLLAAGSFVWRHVRLERLVGERTMELGEANTLLRHELADRQRVEQERARLEGQLHQAQKLEAVGRLAGGIAHDFNNLLTVITGFAELARDDDTASPSVRASIDEITKAAERASALSRQVLAFSRQQVVMPAPLDVNAVVADIERMLHRLIGEDIALVFRPGPDLAPVFADRGQIEQVLVNLAVNARDAMPDGGQLAIETSNVELDEAFTRAHAGTRPGPHVQVTVTDTGAGMDAETRARIFEPFFTTKEKGKGTGLGLATVYGIVAQAAGHIWVESEPGRGTTFTIYLPRTEHGPAAAPAAAGAEAPGGSEHILIVEDDDAVRHVAATTLRRLGYAVDVVASAEAALERLRDRSRPPDLVLTDIVLKGMSGIELAAQAREACPTLRLVFMSGYADSALMRRGPIQADAHFIQKPFTAAALGQKVRDAIDAPPSG
jgi:signal transduction histidine kinase/CheY-like chemotaxis protein